MQSLGGSDKVHLFQQHPGLQQHLLLNSYDVRGHSPLKSEGPDKCVFPENRFYRTAMPPVYLHLIFEISSVTRFFFNFEISSLKS